MRSNDDFYNGERNHVDIHFLQLKYYTRIFILSTLMLPFRLSLGVFHQKIFPRRVCRLLKE